MHLEMVQQVEYLHIVLDSLVLMVVLEEVVADQIIQVLVVVVVDIMEEVEVTIIKVDASGDLVVVVAHIIQEPIKIILEVINQVTVLL